MASENTETPLVRRVAARLAGKETRDRFYRILAIALMLVLVGCCVFLVGFYVMELQALVVGLGGVLIMVGSMYLFVRLWPTEVEQGPKVGEKVAEALKEPEPEPLSPEEYRKQRELAQKLIRDKAAPALAKAIRGILRAEEMKERGRR